MNQKHVSHLIDDYIDGALNAEERTYVELHIKDCPQCRKELSELEAVVHDLQRLPKSIAPSEQLQTALNRQLLQYGSNHHAARNQDTGVIKILRSPWILRIAAGIVVLIGAGIFTWSSLHKSTTVENITTQKFETPPPAQSITSNPEVLPGETKKTVTKRAERMKLSEPVALAPVRKGTVSPALAVIKPHAVKTDTLASRPAVVITPQGKTPAKRTGVGTLNGKILDSMTGEPLIGANVVLNGTSLGAATNVDGEYKIMNVPEGSYNVKVGLVGYGSQTINNISVQSDSTRQMDFRIVPQTIAGQEVVVTAQVRGQMAAINQHLSSSRVIVSAERIQAMPYESRPPFNTEDYSKVDENEFKDALTNPLSTFSIDVDAASYSNVRRFIQNGQLPPRDAVRIEELINYFKYDYPQPTGRHPFSVNTEVARCPWNSSNTLLLVGLQGKTIDAEKLPSSNLVFLIDVSGSMDEPNKLPLVKAAFRVLVRQLRPQDRVAIVVYAGNAGLVLPSTPGSDKEKILHAIESLEAGGSTAGGEGIKLAYNIARESFLKGGNNRVILATDGDFNVGISSEGELLRLIEEERRDNIFLSVLGFGMGNYKDAKMEKLADRGNGNFSYIDGIQEARKVLGEQMAGTLYTIAKDVKIQVEFNPALVKSYRLIGYENRLLNKEDFKDDKKDAGELGAGHTVTALYELVMNSDESAVQTAESLKYQTTRIKPESFQTDELLTVQLRYKLPADTASILMSASVKKGIERLESSSRNIRFASAVAMFGMILRESKYRADASYDLVLMYAKDSKGTDAEGYNAEFVKLVETCQLLGSRREH